MSSEATLRWLLVSDDVVVAACAQVEGLFVDLPPRLPERFTLVGCHPQGALADLPERSWLGDLSITEPPSDEAPDWWGVDLGDVVVLARRPSVTMPGTLDIDLEGFVHLPDRTEAVHRPGRVTRFALVARDATPYGSCRDVTGVFRAQAAAPVPQIRLLGCRPEGPLRTLIAESARPGGRPRWIHTDVYTIAADGSTAAVFGGVVAGTVVAGEPSPLGDGLVDVTIDSFPREPLPAGEPGIVDQWHLGRPAEKNLWAVHDRRLRLRWAAAALAHRAAGPDQPPGTTYDLDGSHVTDVEGFYCALGEAINGPGGYFGWNLGAVHDCLSGSFGALAPFRLVWHDSAVARKHLVEGYDRLDLAPAVTLDHLLGMLADRRVEVDLR